MDLFEYQGKQYFSKFGIAVSPGGVADTVEEALAVAERVGYPVVVNIFYKDKDTTDPMFLSPEGNDIKLYHITKTELKSPKLNAVKEARILNDTVQMNNLFYVVTTRAKYEMINFYAEKHSGKEDEDPDE